MNFKRILLAVALLASLGDVRSQTIGVHTVSTHFGANAGRMNNTNPGLYFKSEDGWTAGLFRNSYYRTSVYAGKTWSHDFTSGWQASLTLGGATGYPSYAVLPLVMPTLATPKLDGWRLRAAFGPKFHSNGAIVLHFMAERDWK